MKNKYRKEIIQIYENLNKYYKNFRDNYPNINEDEEFNKNKQIKNNIKEKIITINNDITLSKKEKCNTINEFLRLLAENTGCIEDYQISNEILSELENQNIINQDNINYYSKYENMGRWI